ncbi:hypothetical protein FDA94_28665 [Herbidospora galbida]|uniref:Uncharacterized protein n=1 Tax=Herbidospora galbida TaxID=2575442 RepID=A0A4U3M6Q0_9ACTN|nr:hypothetical protein [Herbidospora galbida]TKK84605.1 hypothetical protein FDA94_28665 [Herbidospora galbida]
MQTTIRQVIRHKRRPRREPSKSYVKKTRMVPIKECTVKDIREHLANCDRCMSPGSLVIFYLDREKAAILANDASEARYWGLKVDNQIAAHHKGWLEFPIAG